MHYSLGLINSWVAPENGVSQLPAPSPARAARHWHPLQSGEAAADLTVALGTGGRRTSLRFRSEASVTPLKCPSCAGHVQAGCGPLRGHSAQLAPPSVHLLQP